jgi:DNA-binding transcriptional ArsR family regulator
MSIAPKQALYAEFASVARALGSQHRLEILEHLAQGERGVEALAERVGLTVANASQHLQQLKRAGLVASRRDGKFVPYRLADEAVLALMAALSGIAERNLAEVDRIRRAYFDERDSMEPVSRAELLQRTRDGLSELEARLAELDPDHEVVAYCRGPWCVLSFEAVAVLRARGFKVRRLEDGLPEWRAAGLPVE